MSWIRNAYRFLIGFSLNAVGVIAILFSAAIFFFQLTVSLDAALQSIWPAFFAGLGAVIILTNTFTKSHEGPGIIVRDPDAHGHGDDHGHGGHGHDDHGHGDDHDDEDEGDHNQVPPVPQPRRNPVAVIQSLLVYVLYAWPVMNAWWHSNVYTTVVTILWIAVPAAYILAPNRFLPPAALYWGWLVAWGVDFLYWGLWGTSWAGTQAEGLTQSGYQALWVVSTCAWIILSLCGWLVLSSRLARADIIFFDIDTAMVKAIKAGSTVTMFIADLTGVPRAIEDVPLHILARGHEAVWHWMLEKPAHRVDIRPFLTEWGWVGPAFGYFGIPFFTQVAKIKGAVIDHHAGHGHDAAHGHGAHGHAGHGHSKPKEFAELRVLPNIDRELKEPVPAGASGVEMTMKIGVVLQLCNTFRVFSTPDIAHTLEHAVEELNANLARELGTALYGFTGNPELLARAVPSIPANAIAPETPGIAAIPRIRMIMAGFVHHLNEVGYHVVEVVIKDVNVSGRIGDILVEKVRTHVQRGVATEQAQIVELVTAGLLKPFMDAADTHNLGEAAKAKVLEELAKMFFLQGGGGDLGRQLGFAVAASSAVAQAQRRT